MTSEKILDLISEGYPYWQFDLGGVKAELAALRAEVARQDEINRDLLAYGNREAADARKARDEASKGEGERRQMAGRIAALEAQAEAADADESADAIDTWLIDIMRLAASPRPVVDTIRCAAAVLHEVGDCGKLVRSLRSIILDLEQSRLRLAKSPASDVAAEAERAPAAIVTCEGRATIYMRREDAAKRFCVLDERIMSLYDADRIEVVE